MNVISGVRSCSAVAVLLLSACGSQLDNIDPPDVRPPSVAPAGIYAGTLTSVASKTTVAVQALVNDQRLYLFDADGSLIGSGRYTTSDRDINWQGRAFRQLGADTADEDDDRTVTITLNAQGGFDPEAQILMSYTATAEGQSGVIDTGTLNLDYEEAQYERRSDLPLVAGTWIEEDDFGAVTSYFTVSDSGTIFGQSPGCSYSGQLALIDQPYNLYSALLSPQCGANTPNPQPPPAAGLATLRRESNGDLTLLIVTTNGDGGSLLELRPG